MEEPKNKLSDKINKFESDIKFLSNKEDDNDIETKIHEYISDSLKNLPNEKKNLKQKKDSKMTTENLLKNEFKEIRDNKNSEKINLVKNLNLEKEIKEDFIKRKINTDKDRLHESSLKVQIGFKKKMTNNLNLLVLFTSAYSVFFLSLVYYNQKLNKFDNIQDLINNKPSMQKKKKLNIYLIPFIFSFFLFKYYRKEINNIDKVLLYNLENDNKIDIDKEIKGYKFHKL